MADNNTFMMAFDELNSKFEALQANSDDFFLLVMACIIFFMQAGFAFLEAGSVRSKNTTNILLKNLLDTCLGAFVYWSFGYAFAFGAPGNPFIGTRYFFFENMPSELYSHWFFHFVFAATAATIVSGAMAERTDLLAYFIYSCIITGFIYPVVTHWAWDGTGWLANGPGVAYQDFAGSGVVHMVGGTAALVGAAILGPRIGRFDEDGTPQNIEGHTVPHVALGGFILFFGFFAFNGGSQASISAEGDGAAIAIAIVNTIISGGTAALMAMGIKRAGFQGKRWSLLTAINGGLTGMVAICAGCNAVAAWGAFLIGLISGVTYIFWSWLVLNVMKVDDPLDAVAVHLGGGLWGVISVPLLSYQSGILTNWDNESGKILGWNLLAAIVIFAWTSVLSLLLFGSLRLAGILRVSEEIELKGLDIPKHGEPAYPLSAYGHGWGSKNVTNGTNGNNAHVNGAFTNENELPACHQTTEVSKNQQSKEENSSV